MHLNLHRNLARSSKERGPLLPVVSCFNIAVFCGNCGCRTKRELKTGDRAILWQGEQFTEFKA